MNNSTIFDQIIVALLACTLGAGRLSAQEQPPVGEVPPSVQPAVAPALPTPDAPVAGAKMPDISGTWRMGKNGEFGGDAAIRRVMNGTADFDVELLSHPTAPRHRFRWSQTAQCFNATMIGLDGLKAKITLKVLADGKTLRFIMVPEDEAKKELLKRGGSQNEVDAIRHEQEWTRLSMEVKSPATTEVQQPSASKADPEQTPLTNPAKAAASEEGHIKVFSLANGSALECSKLLNDLSFNARITSDLRTNSVIVQFMDEDQLQAIEAILLKLDEAPSTPAAPKTDAAISFTPAPVPASTGIPNTPAAKQLIEQLQAQESAAAAEAATIRQLRANGQAEQNKQPIAEHQRKLKNLLSTAFDLKLQLEELQVKELQSRLSRLERQIGQRKELREKIIARRAAELIEGDTLTWDSTGAASESVAETTSKSNPTNPTRKPVASSEMTTQVHFTGPKGMEVLIADEAMALIAPVRHNFLRTTFETQRYDIGFRKASGDPDLQLVALLDIYPSTPATEGFLSHNSVPITITDQDTQRASSELLIKVVYLPTPSSVKAAIPEIRILESSSFILKGDEIAIANQFGTILAVLRLAKNVDQLGKLDPKSNNAAITRPRRLTLRNAIHQVTIDFPMANFPVIPGDRIEVQHVLHAEAGFHGPGKTIASGLEVVGVARSLSLPTRTALTLATTPEMAAMLEHLATTGLLFCHPLDPVAMLPCGRAVRIPLGIRQEGRLTVGDAVKVDRMSLVIAKNNLAEPKFVGFAYGLLIGFEEGDIPEGTTEPKTIVKLLLPKDPTGSGIDAHVFQNRVDELIGHGALFRGERSERGDTTQFQVAVTEIEWQIESLEKRIAYYQAHVFDNAAIEKDQRNLADQHIRLHRLKYQQGLYKTSSEFMARVRPLNSAVNDEPPPP